jgi:protein involved in polysaccharide export with SLBB domain
MERSETMPERARWLRAWSLVGLGYLLCAVSSISQTQMDMRLPDISALRSELKPQASSSLDAKSVPVDGPVSPEEYFIGPGDVLAINIWTSIPAEHQLTVTPEGLLLIPSVGSVDLTNCTLAAARARVRNEVGRKYPRAEITLSLLTPRKLRVQVTGQVMNEGPHDMYAVQRVDNLIESANTLPSTAITKKFYDQDLQQLRRDRSERYIVVQHRDGTSQRVDLVRFRLTGEGKWNPYLRDGDNVHVPPRSEIDNTIGIYGGVIRPGGVEWVAGDSLTDLLHLGLGLRPLAGPDSAVLTRLSADGRRMDTLSVDIKGMLEGRLANIALKPGDRLVVLQGREYREGNIVRLEGEVVRPGPYPITANDTKLTEVLRMAGGFTPSANVRAASLLRARVSPLERSEEIQQERLLAMRASLTNEDTAYYLTESELRIKGELVSVDFQKLFIEKDSTRDVTLRNYDRIIVPPSTHTIYVYGQVISPGHIAWMPGSDVDYYIRKAGGFTNEARTGDVMVIKGNNRTWLEPDETMIEDGDGVWIPKKIDRTFSYYLTTYSQIAGIIATAVSLAVLVSQIN